MCPERNTVTLKGSTEATVNQPLSMQLAEKHAAQRSVKRTRKQMRKSCRKGSEGEWPGNEPNAFGHV